MFASSPQARTCQPARQGRDARRHCWQSTARDPPLPTRRAGLFPRQLYIPIPHLVIRCSCAQAVRAPMHWCRPRTLQPHAGPGSPTTDDPLAYPSHSQSVGSHIKTQLRSVPRQKTSNTKTPLGRRKRRPEGISSSILPSRGGRDASRTFVGVGVAPGAPMPQEFVALQPYHGSRGMHGASMAEVCTAVAILLHRCSCALQALPTCIWCIAALPRGYGRYLIAIYPQTRRNANAQIVGYAMGEL